MRITIAAVGRAKAGPARDLFELYCQRSQWPLELREVEEKKALTGAKLVEREGELLLAALPKDQPFLALDERGKNRSSQNFAALLRRYRDEGTAHLGFVIGGADGLSEVVRQGADGLIAFGSATWPHILVRGLLAEQLYRAQTILAGHPYHRD